MAAERFDVKDWADTFERCAMAIARRKPTDVEWVLAGRRSACGMSAYSAAAEIFVAFNGAAGVKAAP